LLKQREEGKLKVSIETLGCKVLWVGEVREVMLASDELRRNGNAISIIRQIGDTLVMCVEKCPSVIGMSKQGTLWIGHSYCNVGDDAKWWLAFPKEGGD